MSYRLLICGSSSLENEKLISFAEALGREIAKDDNLVIVTGGLKKKEGEKFSTDYRVVKSAERELQENEIIKQRIITILPDKEEEQEKRFEVGNTITVRHSNSRSRRFSMLRDCDIVLAIEGRAETGLTIDASWGFGLPVLPLPFTGGHSKNRWDAYEDVIKKQFNLTEEEMSWLDSAEYNVDERASLCVTLLKRVLKPKCFLAMQFENHPISNYFEIFKEIVEGKGYSAIRIDQEAFNGSIVDAIWDSIKSSSIIVADITPNIILDNNFFNPNVFYELGISHALGKEKETVLTLFSNNQRIPTDIPFDIRVHRIHPYDSENSLQEVLKKNIPPA